MRYSGINRMDFPQRTIERRRMDSYSAPRVSDGRSCAMAITMAITIATGDRVR